MKKNYLINLSLVLVVGAFSFATPENSGQIPSESDLLIYRYTGCPT